MIMVCNSFVGPRVLPRQMRGPIFNCASPRQIFRRAID